MASLVHIFICPEKGGPMRTVKRARTIIGKGLEGDRYVNGGGTWNKGEPGKRQVTLINLASFKGTDFRPIDSRRNLVIKGIELMRLIGKKFMIGKVLMRGVKYCPPCKRVNKLCGKKGFVTQFSERGGLIAEIWSDGRISVNDQLRVVEAGKRKVK